MKIVQFNTSGRRFFLSIAMLGLSFSSNAELFGPLPYLSFANSPFNEISFSWFYLEDFEDGLLNTPGVIAINNAPNSSLLGVFDPSRLFVDSVDGDDGNIDGLGLNGHSFAASANDGGDNYGHTYTFDPQVLGALPTHVGIVWTDGSKTAPTQFEAFDSLGVSLGIIEAGEISDNSFFGTTGEDRFFGVTNETGISSFTIRNPGGDNTLEVDHLQYGFQELSCTVSMAGTVSPNLNIHLPSFNYQSLTDTLNLWADFEFYGNDGTNLLWQLKDYGENRGSDVTCAPDDYVVVSPNLDIQLLSIDYQVLSGTLNLWANFEYYGQGNNGELLWRLLEYGENQ